MNSMLMILAQHMPYYFYRWMTRYLCSYSYRRTDQVTGSLGTQANVYGTYSRLSANSPAFCPEACFIFHLRKRVGCIVFCILFHAGIKFIESINHRP